MLFIIFHLYKKAKNRNNLVKILNSVLLENKRYQFVYDECDDILVRFTKYMQTSSTIKKFINIIYIKDNVKRQERKTTLVVFCLEYY